MDAVTQRRIELEMGDIEVSDRRRLELEMTDIGELSDRTTSSVSSSTMTASRE